MEMGGFHIYIFATLAQRPAWGSLVPQRFDGVESSRASRRQVSDEHADCRRKAPHTQSVVTVAAHRGGSTRSRVTWQEDVVGEKLPIEAHDLTHNAAVIRRGDALRLGAEALKTVRGEQWSL